MMNDNKNFLKERMMAENRTKYQKMTKTTTFLVYCIMTSLIKGELIINL